MHPGGCESSVTAFHDGQSLAVGRGDHEQVFRAAHTFQSIGRHQVSHFVCTQVANVDDRFRIEAGVFSSFNMSALLSVVRQIRRTWGSLGWGPLGGHLRAPFVPFQGGKQLWRFKCHDATSSGHVITESCQISRRAGPAGEMRRRAPGATFLNDLLKQTGCPACGMSAICAPIGLQRGPSCRMKSSFITCRICC